MKTIEQHPCPVENYKGTFEGNYKNAIENCASCPFGTKEAGRESNLLELSDKVPKDKLAFEEACEIPKKDKDGVMDQTLYRFAFRNFMQNPRIKDKSIGNLRKYIKRTCHI